MRFLHVSPAYAPFRGGAEQYIRQVSERLAALAHQVTVVTTQATEARQFRVGVSGAIMERDRLNEVERIRLPIQGWGPVPVVFDAAFAAARGLDRLSGKGGARAALALPRVRGLRTVLRSAPDCDLVHAVNLHYPALACAGHAEALRRGIPFVITPFLHLDASNGFPRRLFSRTTIALAQSERERHALIRLGVAPDCAILGGVGVDPAALRSGDAARFREEHTIRSVPIVAFIGAATAGKGAFTLLRAMQALWLRGEEAALVVAGTADPSFARLMHSEPRAHYLGPVADEVKHDLLAAAAILAMPSRVESLGVAYLEAWANGLPVIGARAGATPELIADGESGLLVPFGDAPALAHAIGTLLRDDRLRSGMGSAGRTLVEVRFTWEHVMSRVLAAYRMALAQ